MTRYCFIAFTLILPFVACAPAIADEDDSELLDILKKNKIPEDLLVILQKAEQIELLSLSPDQLPKDEIPKDAFHDWKVLGKTTVSDAEMRQKLVAAFKKGVDEGRGGARCFSPRHGIRATYGGKTADFVICFECMNVAVYGGDKAERGFSIANSPQEVFNTVLKEAKVSLAPEKEQGAGVLELSKAQLLKNAPNFFYFDYQFEPKPGKRYWLRIDNKTWIERYPDGEETKFEIIGRASVDDCAGILIQKAGEKTFQVFIPDKGSKQMWLRFRHTQVSDKWSNLAEMLKVE